jgi:hypothetical protein
MTSYKVKKFDSLYGVVESATNHIIFESNDEHKAKTMSRKLNFGAAFDGWTPNFFTKKVNVDQIFAMVSDK